MELRARPLLQDRSLVELRKMCDFLKLFKIGNKANIVDRILKYMTTPEGRRVALKDPFLTNLCSTPIPPVESVKHLQCYCVKSSADVVVCSRCANSQHRECIEPNCKLQPYICASCQLTLQDPLEEVRQEIVKPFLVNVALNTRPVHFVFDVALDRSRFSLKLRSVQIDEIGFIATWPKWGYVSVNGTRIQEFKTQPNPNAKKRKDTSIEITNLVQRGENVLEVCKSNDNEAYVACIYLVEKLTERQLIDKFIAAPHIPRASTIAILEHRQSAEDVSSESEKVSLRCPYSKTLLQYPVKGTACEHAQCFSLEPYVCMQKFSKVNRWRCPICKKLAISLGLDELFIEIMHKAGRYSDPEYVEISRNGSLRILDFEGNPAPKLLKRLHPDDNPSPPHKRYKSSQSPTTESMSKKASEIGGIGCPIELD